MTGSRFSLVDSAEQPMTDDTPRSHYGNIIVVGGGCYGSYYVRQLGRASRAGVLEWEHLLVVDRDERCAVARGEGELEWHGESSEPQIVVAEWRQFFDSYLSEAAQAGHETSDAIVPSPLMPHLMYEWLLDRARRRWPQRTVSTIPLPAAPGMPWQSASPDGTHYVSFATWTCPINCIEPAICPRTRGERSWSMPPALEQYVSSMTQIAPRLLGPLVFHCTHRAYGVGMIDVADVMAADRFVDAQAATERADFLVGTVSHCHGALNVLHVE